MSRKQALRSVKQGRNLRRRTSLFIAGSALIIGVLVLPQAQKKPPKVDAISPSAGSLNQPLTLTGSGFTPHTNNILVEGQTVLSNLSSSNGTTIAFTLPSDTPCKPPAACPIKVSNENGVSNASPFKITKGSEARPLLWSSGISIDSPEAVDISPGESNVEVFRVKIKADVGNDGNIQVDGVQFNLYGSVSNYSTFQVDCSRTIEGISVVEAVNEQVLGGGSVFPSGMSSNCMDYLSVYPAVIIPPGGEKTLSLRLSLENTAQVGQQFRVGIGPVAELVFKEGYEGYQGYTESSPYPDPQGSEPTITIVSP